MAYRGAANVYIYFGTLFFLISSSLSYVNYTLENGKVCSQIRKRELKLGEKENSAITVKELRYFDNWSGHFPFNCTFSVLAPHDYGIIAVIQDVVLRQNETTQECIDFIQFKQQFFSWSFPKKQRQSPKYCGKVNYFHDPEDIADVKEDRGEYEVANNAFIDEKGHLDVFISVAGQRLVSSEYLDISVIFTAYRSCRDAPPGFRPCKVGSDICIWEGFFDDKNVNCPFSDCEDEGSCPVIFPGKRHSSGLGTKVTIGAVVAILALLLLFMLCLFVCRHCQILCWAGPPPVRPQSTVQHSTRVEMTPSVADTSGQSQPIATAPPLLPAQSPVHEDKDLPPPYESLFPSR